MTSRGPSWSDLGWQARAWRLVHAAWSVAQLSCVALIWERVIRRRRDRALWGSVAFVGIEGVALIAGRGQCPMGPRQDAWGDPIPFFELLLPPRAARAAVPVLFLFTVAALAGLVARPPRPAGWVRQRDPIGTRAQSSGRSRGGGA